MSALLERRSAVGWLLTVPGAARQFREVPQAYWRPHGKGERRRIALPPVPLKVRVECPCGNRPVLVYGELVECRERAPSPHRCSRRFVWTGGVVLVAGGPKAA